MLELEGRCNLRDNLNLGVVPCLSLLGSGNFPAFLIWIQKDVWSLLSNDRRPSEGCTERCVTTGLMYCVWCFSLFFIMSTMVVFQVERKNMKFCESGRDEIVSGALSLQFFHLVDQMKNHRMRCDTSKPIFCSRNGHTFEKKFRLARMLEVREENGDDLRASDSVF